VRFSYFQLDPQPAALLPSGVTQRDLPVGLRLVGANGGDDLVPRAHRAYEAVAPFLILEAPRQC
jgi:Asp-tRNA(Asn)/Glu-tRNA(Gln) amidotransferase A subunit family amidase